MAKDGRDKSHLSGEDAELWARVTGTTKPLRKPANRHVETPDPALAPAAKKKKSSKSSPATVRPSPEAPARPSEPPPVGGYQRSEERALASGRLDIEGRIDLHGMRQVEAHRALLSFIERCRARGQRHLLVITGKGSGEHRGEPGVLKREVPRWLNEPEFRRSVVGFTHAHKRHGGEGALYVRLRRNRPED